LCIAVSAPHHLQPNTRRWFAGVSDEYELEPHHQRLLQAAAEAWDRLQEAREVLRKDGTYVEGRYEAGAPGYRADPRNGHWCPLTRRLCEVAIRYEEGKARPLAGLCEMELAGLEPATSWIPPSRSLRSLTAPLRRLLG
jgi:hypothetical protein